MCIKYLYQYKGRETPATLMAQSIQMFDSGLFFCQHMFNIRSSILAFKYGYDLVTGFYYIIYGRQYNSQLSNKTSWNVKVCNHASTIKCPTTSVKSKLTYGAFEKGACVYFNKILSYCLKQLKFWPILCWCLGIGIRDIVSTIENVHMSVYQVIALFISVM